MIKEYIKEYKDLTQPALDVERAMQRLRLDVNTKNIREANAAITLINKAMEYKLGEGVPIERFTKVFDNLKILDDMMEQFKKDYKEITERLQVLEALA